MDAPPARGVAAVGPCCDHDTSGQRLADRIRYPDACVLIAAMAPVPGQVKTRLAPALGPRGAARERQVGSSGALVQP